MEKLLNIFIGIVLVAVLVVGGLLVWSYLTADEDFVGTKLEKDLQDWEGYVDENPDDPLGWANLGAIYLEMGDTDKAIEELQTAVALAPEGYTYRYKLGQAYRAAERTPEAIDTMKQAVDNFPPGERALITFELAEIFWETEDLASAKDYVQQSIKVDATIWNSRYLLGQILEKEGDQGGARSEYEAAAKFSNDPVIQQALERVST